MDEQDPKSGAGWHPGWDLGATNLARRAVSTVGGAIGGGLSLFGLFPRTLTKPGAPAGIENAALSDTPPEEGAVVITCTDYCPNRIESVTVQDLDAFLKTSKPDWANVRWINVDGLHPYVIRQIQGAFKFHTLVAEDVLHVPQRPRVEEFENHVFTVMRSITLTNQHLCFEQISAFLYPGLLLTFQQWPGDVWGPLRQRLQLADSRVRALGPDFLLYGQLDAIVDHVFPVLENFGSMLEDLEAEVLGDPGPDVLQRIQAAKRELATLRRVMWPTREALDVLLRLEGGLVEEKTAAYIRDVYSHSVQLIDIIETYRDTCSSLTDLYMSVVSNRMNETMKVLTIMASLFIPITFLAGVFGMNFDDMPELHWSGGYTAFWIACLTITAGLLWFFRRKRWL